MQIVEYSNEFRINVPFNRLRNRNVAAIKKVPGARFDYVKKVWIVPLQQRTVMAKLKAYTGAKYFKIDNSPEQLGDIPALPELTQEIPLSHPEGFGLRPYQRKGVARGLELKRFMNCDEQGLGKTLQSIATLYAAHLNGEKVFPALVICPSSTKINWKREWEMWTDRKAMLLETRIKDSWHRYHEIGMADVFITNYESLKKYFVTYMPPKGQRKKSTDIRMDPRVNLLKSIIVDESHRCFTYETKVLTDQGWIMIGDIVENRMDHLRVASACTSTGKISFKPINNFWKNENKGRILHRIRAGGCHIDTTEEHKVFVEGKGWKKAKSIRNTENLWVLPERFLDQKNWEDNSEVLQQELCIYSKERGSTDKSENGQEQAQGATGKNVPGMRRKVPRQASWKKSRGRSFLLSKLFGKMANETARGAGSSKNSSEKRKAQDICHKSDERSIASGHAFRANEKKQSDVIAKGQKKGLTCEKGQTFFKSTGKRTCNKTSKVAYRGTRVIGKSHGVSYCNSACERSVRKHSERLQVGHRHSRNKTFYRGRRSFTSFQKSQEGRPIENSCIESVRVDSNTVLELGHSGGYGQCIKRDQYLYDLEVADNHNYFANGILVSNCKDTGTQQAQITLQISLEKEWVILLTGTPVVNKPLDLYPQLGILGRLPQFGGIRGYRERYCEGGRGASNLKELNYLLNKHCFFRREKKDVAKDLPDKQRQTILCDITTREAYNRARDKFALYLKEKGCDDKEIAKKLRGEILAKMMELKKISAYGKLNEAKEFIHQVVDSGEKLIVFVWHTIMVDELKKEFPTAVTVTGKDDQNQKQRSIDSFQQNDNTKLIICNIKAAGVGITLTASSRVAFIEYPWTYADCVQCEDRAHRIGQKNNVMCTYFLGQNTIDEDLYQMIQEKRHVGNTITGATDQMKMNMVDNMINLFTK